ICPIPSAAPWSVLFHLTFFSINSQLIRQGQSTNLSCSKKKSISTAMHWYRLPLGKDSRLVLVASALEAGKATVEEDLRSHLKSSEIQGDKITLLIEHAFLNDSGTYYCAESETQWLGC
uniref:Ig-like domain-containing protein n=1 Tax=Otus sunia TaxID=257818 RepID=A0A8C8AT51_9STRI